MTEQADASAPESRAAPSTSTSTTTIAAAAAPQPLSTASGPLTPDELSALKSMSNAQFDKVMKRVEEVAGNSDIKTGTESAHSPRDPAPVAAASASASASADADASQPKPKRVHGSVGGKSKHQGSENEALPWVNLDFVVNGHCTDDETAGECMHLVTKATGPSTEMSGVEIVQMYKEFKRSIPEHFRKYDTVTEKRARVDDSAVEVVDSDGEVIPKVDCGQPKPKRTKKAADAGDDGNGNDNDNDNGKDTETKQEAADSEAATEKESLLVVSSECTVEGFPCQHRVRRSKYPVDNKMVSGTEVYRLYKQLKRPVPLHFKQYGDGAFSDDEDAEDSNENDDTYTTIAINAPQQLTGKRSLLHVDIPNTLVSDRDRLRLQHLVVLDEEERAVRAGKTGSELYEYECKWMLDKSSFSRWKNLTKSLLREMRGKSNTETQCGYRRWIWDELEHGKWKGLTFSVVERLEDTQRTHTFMFQYDELQNA